LFIPASRAEILELSLVDRQDRVFLAVQKSLAQHPDQGNSTAGMVAHKIVLPEMVKKVGFVIAMPAPPGCTLCAKTCVAAWMSG
jgi:hypothetical protein